MKKLSTSSVLMLLIMLLIFLSPACLKRDGGNSADPDTSPKPLPVEEPIDQEAKPAVPKEVLPLFFKTPGPDILPPSGAWCLDFSHDSSYLAVGHSGNPFLTIYKRSGNQFTKLPDPAELPSGVVKGVAFSHDSNYLAVAHNSHPFITIYKRNGDSFLKLPDPDHLPASDGKHLAFSHDSSELAVIHSGKPCLTIYIKDGDTFTRAPNPPDLPELVRAYSGIAYSDDSEYMALSTLSRPYLAIYRKSGSNYLRVADTSITAATTATNVEISANSKYIAVASEQAPRITVYRRNGDEFYQLPTPSDIPGFTAESVAFSHDASLLAVACWGGAKPSVIIYQLDNDSFLKLPGLVDPPEGRGMDLSFSHDSAYLAVAHSYSPYLIIYKISSGQVEQVPGQERISESEPLLSSEQPLFHAPWRGTYPISQGNNNLAGSHRPGSNLAWALDIYMNVGEQVLAPADGVVIQAGYGYDVIGGSKSIRLLHTGPTGKKYITSYLHLCRCDDAIKVNLGEEVKMGQVIALSGDTGIVSAPHLHFELAEITDINDLAAIESGRNFNKQLPSIPIEQLMMRRLGIDDDFVIYNAVKGELEHGALLSENLNSYLSPFK